MMSEMQDMTISIDAWLKQTRITECKVEECRFWDEGHCQLKHIDLNSNGQCNECDQ